MFSKLFKNKKNTIITLVLIGIIVICAYLIYKKQNPNEEVFNDKSNVVLMKGERLDSPGFFMTPTVYMTSWANKSYLKNEVFGPHVAIIPFKTKEEAVHIYNDTDYGLAVGIITENFKTARFMRDECDFGMCYWNGGSIAAESHLAF